LGVRRSAGDGPSPAGHFVVEERPGEVVRILVEFFADD
jgi:hypothetical protein